MLSARLKQVRNEKKITQDQVADALNVKRQTYSAYERGVSVPDANVLAQLAQIFCTSTDYLLGLTDDSTPAKERAAGMVQSGGQYEDLTPEQIEKIKAFEAFIRTEYNEEKKAHE